MVNEEDVGKQVFYRIHWNEGKEGEWRKGKFVGYEGPAVAIVRIAKGFKVRVPVEQLFKEPVN